MLNGKPITIHGATFRPGDMISTNESTVLVHHTDPEENEVCLYHFESETSQWVSAEGWLRNWFLLQDEGAQVWQTLVHDTKKVLVDGQLVPHTISCHMVMLTDPPEGHPKRSFCLSWEETKEEFTYPLDGNYAKYKTITGMETALNNLDTRGTLSTLAEWQDRNETVAEFIDSIPEEARELLKRRSKEGQHIANNADMLHDILFEQDNDEDTVNADLNVETAEPDIDAGTTVDEADEADGFNIEWYPADELEDDGQVDADADEYDVDIGFRESSE